MYKKQKVINNIKEIYLKKKERKNMLKLKKMVVLLVVLLLVWSIAIQVQATNLTLDLTNLTADGNTVDNNGTNTATNSATLNVATNREASVVQPVANSSANDSSAGNNLPQTGVTEDITVMFFIIVCVIAAIYAYKKIRDYRV